MNVRRVFFILHEVSRDNSWKKTNQKQDFDSSKSHDECYEEILNIYGRRNPNRIEQFKNFAEVISSTITESEHSIPPPFQAPKHFGTDLLLDARDWANMEDASKLKKMKNRKKFND